MNLTTPAQRLFVARAEAAANTTFSDNLATQGDFANKPTGAIDILDPAYLDPTTESSKKTSIIAVSEINGLQFSFAGGDAADDAFTWTIFAWRNENGPATIVCNGTGILGTQAVTLFPHNNGAAADKFWADTLVISNDRWFKEVEATSDGGNSVSHVWFDTCGYRYFYVEIPESIGVMSSYFGYF
jgi:hypothetical protein